MMKSFLLAAFLCPFYAIMAQPGDTTLNERLRGKTKLNDILGTVKDYYEPRIARHDGSDVNYRKLRKWNRWGLYMSNRVNPDGTPGDVIGRKEEALRQWNETSGATNRPFGTVGNWSFIGPSTVSGSNINLGVGRCDRIAFHPTDSNTLFIGAPEGGLWKSINGGQSWFCLTNQLANQSISGIVVDYSNPSILYILTGEGDLDIFDGLLESIWLMKRSTGVYKSVDGGLNWNLTGPLSNIAYTGLRLVQDPSNPNVLLAGTSDGIFRTSNGGVSWTKVRNFEAYDIEYAPGNPSIVYSSAYSTVYYSVDGGVNWNNSSLTGTLEDRGRLEIAVTPANPAVVYALCGNANSDTTFAGIYKSTDYGVHFIQQSHTPNIVSSSQSGNGGYQQGMYDLALAASPTNSNLLITGAINLWKSTNGGSSLTDIMFDGSNNRKIHTDIHDLKYSPLNGALYCANDGGFYKSYDNGTSWYRISNGLGVGMIYHLAGIDADEDYLLAGFQDNGLMSRKTLTTTYDFEAGGDGFGVSLRHNANTAGNDWGIVSINEKVYKLSLSGGLSNPFSNLGRFFPSVTMNTNVSNIMYCGFLNVFKSSNGVDWFQKDGYGSWGIAICPSNTSRVFSAGGEFEYGPDNVNGRLDRTDDGGDHWTPVFTTANYNFSKITDIAVNPSNSDRVWITLGGYYPGEKVYYSNTGGNGWTNVTANLPNTPVLCIAVDASNNAYIGTDIGVFYLGNGQSQWMPFRNGMPIVPVTDLVINPNAGLIRAATFGRGIYSSELYANCDPSLTLNGSYGGFRNYEASSSIISAGLVFGGGDTHVNFKAGDSLVLKPGFTVAMGNEFSAYLGTCGSGFPFKTGAAGEIQVSAGYPSGYEGGLEVHDITENGCRLIIRPGSSAKLTLLVADDNNGVIKTVPLTSPGTELFEAELSFRFEPGKKYRAFLYGEGKLLNWQEIIPKQ